MNTIQMLLLITMEEAIEVADSVAMLGAMGIDPRSEDFNDESAKPFIGEFGDLEGAIAQLRSTVGLAPSEVSLSSDGPDLTGTDQIFLLINREALLLAQRVSKTMRFGCDEVQPGQERTNLERVLAAHEELRATVNALCRSQCIDLSGIPWAISEKQKKIARYMDLSRQCGQLDD